MKDLDDAPDLVKECDERLGLLPQQDSLAKASSDSLTKPPASIDRAPGRPRKPKSATISATSTASNNERALVRYSLPSSSAAATSQSDLSKASRKPKSATKSDDLAKTARKPKASDAAKSAKPFSPSESKALAVVIPKKIGTQLPTSTSPARNH